MGRKPWRIDKISTYFLSAGGGVGNWKLGSGELGA